VSVADNQLLRGHQRKPKDPNPGKLFDVTKISSLILLEESFERPKSPYNPNDQAFKQIICRAEK